MRTSRALGMISLVVILITQVGARRASGRVSAGGDAKRFIGTWRLVSDVSTGLMYYDSLGNMAAQVMQPLASEVPGVQPAPEEAQEAITGYLASFGTYTVTRAFAPSLTIARPISIADTFGRPRRSVRSFPTPSLGRDHSSSTRAPPRCSSQSSRQSGSARASPMLPGPVGRATRPPPQRQCLCHRAQPCAFGAPRMSA